VITLTVHEEPSPRADRIDRAERLEFVKDGFSLIAAYLAPFWLLANRLWLALAGYLGVVVLLSVATAAFDLSPSWLSFALLVMHLVVGFEGDSLKRSGLERRGWSMVGSVTGRNRAECERRFFDNWIDGTPAIAARTPVRGLPATSAVATAPAPGPGTAGRFGRWLSPKTS